MSTVAADALKRLDEQRDERELNQRVKWFVDKWSERLDASREETAELSADLVMVVQAVHRDASRETHALLMKALAAMPPATLIVSDGMAARAQNIHAAPSMEPQFKMNQTG